MPNVQPTAEDVHEEEEWTPPGAQPAPDPPSRYVSVNCGLIC
jgi:hypothetical protein